MPNHVTNVVRAPKHVIAALAPEGKPTFQGIIPMPEALIPSEGGSVYVDAESRAKMAAGLLNKPQGGDWATRFMFSNEIDRSFTPASKETLTEVIKHLTALRDYGDTSHLDWARRHWETKWDAYWANPERNTETAAHFKTAWSFPEPVAIRLSELFPNDEIVWEYADEDHGSNCGTLTLLGGKIIRSVVAPPWKIQSSEERRQWTKFAILLRYPGSSPADFDRDENWECIEED